MTKIRGKYLEALEEDDFEVLPGSTCVVAFLRTYSSFLKLDADGLVEAYKKSYEPRSDEQIMLRTDVARAPRTPTSIERKKKRIRRQQGSYALAAVIAIVVVALLAWFGTGRGQDAASIGAENISGATATNEVMVTGDSASPTTVSGDSEKADQFSDEGATSGEAEGTTSTEFTGSDATAGVATIAGSEGAYTADGNLKLAIEVTRGSCWLVIREDSESGAEVFAGTLSEGGEQTFDSSKRYWMMVGSPESLAVSVGDKSYTLAAPAGAFLVTEAGIERSR